MKSTNYIKYQKSTAIFWMLKLQTDMEYVKLSSKLNQPTVHKILEKLAPPYTAERLNCRLDMNAPVIIA